MKQRLLLRLMRAALGETVQQQLICPRAYLDGGGFMAHHNDQPADHQSILACKACSNKTYLALYDKTSDFPRLQCAACHRDAGHFGWIDPNNLEGKGL